MSMRSPHWRLAGRGILVTRAIQQWSQHLDPAEMQRDEQQERHCRYLLASKIAPSQAAPVRCTGVLNLPDKREKVLAPGKDRA
jgi:hypothetical protein